MSAKYSIDQTTKTLTFTCEQKSLKKHCVKKKDKGCFTSVIIPTSVSNIEPYAFETCSALASVHIPNSVNTIGFRAFCHCCGLVSVHISNSVNGIGGGAFHDCNQLHTVFLQALRGAIESSGNDPSFPNHTSLLRSRLKPITSLQKKSACRASKTSHSIYL